MAVRMTGSLWVTSWTFMSIQHRARPDTNNLSLFEVAVNLRTRVCDEGRERAAPGGGRLRKEQNRLPFYLLAWSS